MTVDVHWWTGPRPGGRWHRVGTTVSIESLLQDGGPRPWRTLCGQDVLSTWTRVMLRLWREVLGPAWPYWPVEAAVSYSRSDRHEGRIYRFDGWARWGEARASSGGGTWTTPRTKDDPAGGPKARWGWWYTP